MEPKKIKITKKSSSSGPSQRAKPITKQKKQDALTILENTVKKLSNRFEQYGFNDSKEEEFLRTNKDKTIVIELNNQEIEGTLNSIDKYRISVNIDDKPHYFYKHAIIGYHVKNEE